MRRDDRAIEAAEHVAGPEPFRDAYGHDVVRVDEGLGQGDDLVDVGAGGEAVADRLEDFLAAEGGDLGGEPVGGSQCGEECFGGGGAPLRRPRGGGPGNEAGGGAPGAD